MIVKKTVGSSSLYQIDLLSGRASRLTLDKSGISSKPVIIEIEDPDATGTGGTKKILIIGSESFDASGSPTFADSGEDVDDLISPGLNKSDTGSIRKINWWESTRR